MFVVVQIMRPKMLPYDSTMYLLVYRKAHFNGELAWLPLTCLVWKYRWWWQEGCPTLPAVHLLSLFTSVIPESVRQTSLKTFLAPSPSNGVRRAKLTQLCRIRTTGEFGDAFCASKHRDARGQFVSVSTRSWVLRGGRRTENTSLPSLKKLSRLSNSW